MTGYYVRVQRDDGSFANVDIAEMTDTELVRFIEEKRRSGDSGWDWVRALSRWIRDNVNQTA